MGFPEGCSNAHKGLLLGALFLVEYNHFEKTDSDKDVDL